jgi:hypothetical protein
MTANETCIMCIVRIASSPSLPGAAEFIIIAKRSKGLTRALTAQHRLATK